MSQSDFRISRRALLGAGAIGLTMGGATAQPERFAESAAITISARPISQFRVNGAGETRFGRCVFRGGLELTADHFMFGGLSGIAVDDDGRGFLAVSDRGAWLRASIVYDGERPAALRDAFIAPVLGANGLPLRGTAAFDCESLCLDQGAAYIGIERVNEIMRFDWARERFAARGRPIPVPPSFKTLPRNRGCECLGVAPRSSPLAGALVAIAEQSEGPSRPTRGYILTGPLRGEFQLALKDDFDATDLVFLPDGDMLVLERFYRPFRGVGMRIRRIDGKTIRPGTLLDGPAMIEADMGYQIDNMEAIGLHVAANGEIVLTLLSDDNFSYLQRTLLLQFALAGE